MLANEVKVLNKCGIEAQGGVEISKWGVVLGSWGVDIDDPKIKMARLPLKVGI